MSRPPCSYTLALAAMHAAEREAGEAAAAVAAAAKLPPRERRAAMRAAREAVAPHMKRLDAAAALADRAERDVYPEPVASIEERGARGYGYRRREQGPEETAYRAKLRKCQEHAARIAEGGAPSSPTRLRGAPRLAPPPVAVGGDA